jgi:hypothetical protein
MPAPNEIIGLVERFQENIVSYTSGTYNETQLRRYAWSAGLPLSILTNFEEFAVYDCRVKPDQNDRPATARILLFNFRDYATRWEEIAAVFTKEDDLYGWQKVGQGTEGAIPAANITAAARTDHEQTNLKRQIDATDHRIDLLVYELYDLTEEEIRIVEKD